MLYPSSLLPVQFSLICDPHHFGSILSHHTLILHFCLPASSLIKNPENKFQIQFLCTSFCDGGSRFSTIPSCPFPCPVKTDKSWKIKEKNRSEEHTSELQSRFD